MILEDAPNFREADLMTNMIARNGGTWLPYRGDGKEGSLK